MAVKNRGKKSNETRTKKKKRQPCTTFFCHLQKESVDPMSHDTNWGRFGSRNLHPQTRDASGRVFQSMSSPPVAISGQPFARHNEAAAARADVQFGIPTPFAIWLSQKQ